uniref:methylated-DNA--[protein]-cysteine S-methyltransferase n=1 Tax=Prevotella sp. GTC17259 TaxID=3236795 RepID=A0AB33J5I0_9BACT
MSPIYSNFVDTDGPPIEGRNGRDSPNQYGRMKIVYGFAQSPFGEIVVARTFEGFCDVQFLGANRMAVIHELAARWGAYTETVQNDTIAQTVERVVFEGYQHELPIKFYGSDFQRSVWQEVQKIPFGTTVSYQELAIRLGRPSAVRAVATAVARNPLAMIVPCHRVVHKDGTVGQYHWGAELKKQLIAWEKSKLTR